MKMQLDLFAGSLTVTVYKDANITTATASPASALAEGDEVELTVTPATGYALDGIEVISGGVEIDPEELTFEMGEDDVVLNVKSKKAGNYIVTEEASICINGAKTVLHKNAVVQLAKNGVPVSVNIEEGGAVVPMSDAAQYLIDQGILVPI